MLLISQNSISVLVSNNTDGNPFKKAPLDRIRMSDIVDCISLEEIQTDRIVACDLSEYAKTNIKWMDLIRKGFVVKYRD